MMLTNSLQNAYLDDLCKSQAVVSIYLMNGIKLSGIISSFDGDVILLKDQKSTMDQLLYKHAISTVVPVINKNTDRSTYVYEQMIYEHELR